MPLTLYMTDTVTLKYLCLFCVYMHVSECTYVCHVSTGALRGQKRVPGTPELTDSHAPQVGAGN